MGPQDKYNRRSFKRVKCKSICDDNKRRRSIKLVARWTTESRSNYGIEIKIYGMMFLHFQKGWLIIAGSELQEAQSSHNKGQDTTTSNWRSN